MYWSIWLSICQSTTVSFYIKKKYYNTFIRYVRKKWWKIKLFRLIGGHKWKWAGKLLCDSLPEGEYSSCVSRRNTSSTEDTKKKKKQNGKKNYTPNISERRERVEKVKREKGRIVRLMWGWGRGKTEQMSGWVGGSVTWVQAAGDPEKLWIHGILDVLTWPVEGVRMDWPPRTNWESKNKREGEMGWWRCGGKEGSKENINGQTETRMDFSSVSSEPNFTAAQEWIE